MIAIAIGPDSARPTSQQVLALVAGSNVFYVANFQSLAAAIDDVVYFIWRMYLTTISRYIMSALNVPVASLK